jgi:hypothetical protein
MISCNLLNFNHYLLAYRQSILLRQTSADLSVQAISIINYVSRDMVVYNHTVLLKNPVFIAALRDQGVRGRLFGREAPEQPHG